jgi:hypothetical protein
MSSVGPHSSPTSNHGSALSVWPEPPIMPRRESRSTPRKSAGICTSSLTRTSQGLERTAGARTLSLSLRSADASGQDL